MRMASTFLVLTEIRRDVFLTTIDNHVLVLAKKAEIALQIQLTLLLHWLFLEVISPRHKLTSSVDSVYLVLNHSKFCLSWIIQICHSSAYKNDEYSIYLCQIARPDLIWHFIHNSKLCYLTYGIASNSHLFATSSYPTS